MKEPAIRVKSRRACWLSLVFICAAAFLWVGYDWWRGQQYRQALAEIKSAIAAKRYGVAANNLGKLLAWRPGSDEAAYLLGACELERGHKPAAAAAWARVAPGSAYSDRAVLAGMQLFHDAGQLAAAERFINETALDSRQDSTAVRILLVPVYRHVGRVDDAVRLVEERWEHLNNTGEGAHDRAISMVRLHVDLTWEATPVASVRHYLDRAYKQAPDDELVCLGLANLAIRENALDDARRWLDACQSRPDDVAVWRARLDLGVATNQVDAVQEAMKHLSAAALTPVQLHRVNAWISAHRGDVASERGELERLIAAEPADLTALDRLAQIAQQDGQPAQAAEYRRKKADMERLAERFKQLFKRNQPIRDAVEMANLADRLGRAFEARAFRVLAGPEQAAPSRLARSGP